MQIYEIFISLPDKTKQMPNIRSHILRNILALIITGCCLMACTFGGYDYEAGRKNIFIIYSIGYNNLDYDLSKDIDDAIENFRPLSPMDILVIFDHTTAKYRNYTIPSSPTLTQVRLSPKGRIAKDTLKIYPETTISSSPETMRQVLDDIRNIHPDADYGILFSSHSTGWAPQDYCNAPGEYDPEADPDLGFDWYARQRRPARHEPTWGIRPSDGSPAVKSFGAQFYKEGTTTKMHEADITDMARCFPMKMDYIIFDSCLMGGIEVAYEFRNVCRYMVFSQTEILSSGMDYSKITSHVFFRNAAGLRAVCSDYYNQYSKQSGDFKSATISLVDCRNLEGLATVCRKIFSLQREDIAALEGSGSVQKYFRAEQHKWFYDLESIVWNAGTPEDLLMEFHEALDKCVLYKAATEKFIGLEINEHCGLSMYLPYAGYDYLNTFYKTLEWNKATGLVE